MPLPSSTAEAHGPSWCEAIITTSSSDPGRSPTTLADSTVRTSVATARRTRTGPAASRSRSRAPSLPRTHTPGSGRSSASYGT